MPTPNLATPVADRLPTIRAIHVSDLNWALSAGWKDFKAKRGDLIVIGLLYPIICIAAAIVTYNDPLLPLFFPLVAGFSIAGPAAASGFYELARRREEGRDASWWHFLDPLNGRSRLPLAMLTGGLAVLFIAWLFVAYAIYAMTFGISAPIHVSDFPARVLGTSAGWQMIVFGNLAGAGFALVTLVFAFVSFPMVVDKPIDADLAISTSLAAFRKNPGVVIGWGVRVGLLLALASIPLGIGLAVMLPWLGYATWHLYTRIVDRATISVPA